MNTLRQPHVATVPKAIGQHRAPVGLAELASLKVALIFVGSPGAAVAATRTAKGIAVVCGSCGDPVEIGLATSLAKPGGNVTGLASLSAELIGKRLVMMRELLPALKRVAVLVYPANPGTARTVEALHSAAQASGMRVQKVEIRTAADFAGAFRSASASGADGVIVQDDPLTRSARNEIAALALKHRLPVSTGVAEVAEAGALFAYGPDRVDMYRRAAVFVDRILKGAKPADLPFEQASRLELILNLKTARALGVSIPQAVLVRAERVIE